jgi:beta-glucosidase
VIKLNYLPDWPAIRSEIAPDDAMEERIRDLVARLTLEEKVGQMIQPELAELTPDDVYEYKIGSALNGAGIWPGGNRRASVADWIETVDTFWAAAEKAYQDRGFRIPFVWATDAVHGHNNVYGATIFPHNIGLGAAGDPDLVRRIGAATAREIAATGMGWTFAPTVTTPRDRRWGRYYEGYSEDPGIVHAYAREMVRGLQGDGPSLAGGGRVIATVKHWVADGGTAYGADRGAARCDEDIVRNIHATGFYSGIEAGAQSVMASFSSWESPLNYDHTPGRDVAYNYKVHGSRYLLTDVLKDRLGFDGIVLSDWDAHAEIAGCTIGDAGYAINAGIDVLMVAGRLAWQSVYRNAVRQVRAGEIPMSRIDDAVSRVLRVKMRAGLWDQPRPSERVAGKGTTVLGCPEHRALSREAVRKSLVLLKNARGALPIARTARVLVTGSGADDIQKQAGGWTLSWQGDDVRLDDLPGATTVAMAVRSVVGAQNTTVDPLLREADPADHDVAVVVIGEDSYAEMRGTIKPWRTLEYGALKQSYARDVEVIRALRRSGITVVTVLLTGRPLYVTEEINASDAFVVAWLPGPEGVGITDVLFAGSDGRPAHDFQGRLANSWPRRKDSMAVNRIPEHIPDYVVPVEETAPYGEHAPLFPCGYGLSLRDGSAAGELGLDLDRLPLHEEHDPTPPPPAEEPIEVLGHDGTAGDYVFRIGGHNTWSRVDISFEQPTKVRIVRVEPIRDPAGAAGLSLRFNGFPAFVYAQAASGEPRDLGGYSAGGRITIEMRVLQHPDRPMLLACHDDYPAQPGLDLTPRLAGVAPGEWTVLEIALSELEGIGSDLRHVDVPFMLYTEGTAHVEVGTVRWLNG